MFRRFLTVALASSFLASCGQGTAYPLPEKEVRAKLMSTSPPELVFGNSGLASSVGDRGDNQIAWTFRANGESVMNIVATVTPNGESSTSVAVAVEPATGKEDGKVAKRMAEHPEIVDLYRAAMSEQIDAKLTGRSFNYMAIRNETIRAGVANQGDMQNAVMKQHEADRADDKRRDEDRADKDPFNQ